MRRIIVVTLKVLILCLLGIIFSTYALMRYAQGLLEVSISKQLQLEIPYGTSVSEINQMLIEQELDLHSWQLRLAQYAYHIHYAKVDAISPSDSLSFKAGSYQLQAHSSLREIFRDLTQGAVQAVTFTFVPGESLAQSLAKLSADEHLRYDLLEVEEVLHQLQTDFAQIYGVAPQRAEGLFLANSYNFHKGTKAREILRLASAKLIEIIEENWDARMVDLPLQNPYEALVLASILEKEAANQQEYPLIASVFINRINRKMRLQADPTVIYGITEGKVTDEKKQLTKQDLKTPTLYNTYVISGLPPSPISAVSKEALLAVLNPAETDYLYFVAHGEKKEHVFSRTLKEHNKAVRNYRKRLRLK